MVDLKPTELVTPPVRLSFPALFEPKPVAKGSDDEKYQASLLLPPDLDMKPFMDAIVAAAKEKWGGNLPKFPAKNNPIKSCDDKELAGYDEGWHYINTKSNYPPTVVDQRRQEIIDPTRIFAGCWCRFHINAYAYDHPVGGKGVSFGLNAVQLVREDARLDGRRDATELFDDVEGFDDSVAFTEEEKDDVDAEELFG